MAFPTSPSNNQVHKEGNRAFVYDSALGTWDQVREADRTEGDLGFGSNFPAGHIVQVQSTTAAESIQINSSSSWVNVTGFLVKITPSSATNKILCAVNYQGGATTSVWSFLSTLRTISGGASTTIGIGNHVSGETVRTRASAQSKFNSDYDVQSNAYMHLDSPATTSEITYQVRVIGNGIFNFNRAISFVNNISTGNFASTITAWEIVA